MTSAENNEGAELWYFVSHPHTFSSLHFIYMSCFCNNLELNLKNYQNDVDTRLSLCSLTDFQGYIVINF